MKVEGQTKRIYPDRLSLRKDRIIATEGENGDGFIVAIVDFPECDQVTVEMKREYLRRALSLMGYTEMTAVLNGD